MSMSKIFLYFIKLDLEFKGRFLVIFSFLTKRTKIKEKMQFIFENNTNKKDLFEDVKLRRNVVSEFIEFLLLLQVFRQFLCPVDNILHFV